MSIREGFFFGSGCLGFLGSFCGLTQTGVKVFFHLPDARLPWLPLLPTEKRPFPSSSSWRKGSNINGTKCGMSVGTSYGTKDLLCPEILPLLPLLLLSCPHLLPLLPSPCPAAKKNLTYWHELWHELLARILTRKTYFVLIFFHCRLCRRLRCLSLLLVLQQQKTLWMVARNVAWMLARV